jgi:hypothetical protein
MSPARNVASLTVPSRRITGAVEVGHDRVETDPALAHR